MDNEKFLKDMFSSRFSVYNDRHWERTEERGPGTFGAILSKINDSLVWFNPDMFIADDPTLLKLFDGLFERIPVARKLLLDQLSDSMVGYEVNVDEKGQFCVTGLRNSLDRYRGLGVLNNSVIQWMNLKQNDDYHHQFRLKFQDGIASACGRWQGYPMKYKFPNVNESGHHDQFCIVDKNVFDYVSSIYGRDSASLVLLHGVFFFKDGKVVANIRSDKLHKACLYKSDLEDLMAA